MVNFPCNSETNIRQKRNKNVKEMLKFLKKIKINSKLLKIK